MDRFTFSICIAAPESGALTVEDVGATTAVQRRQVCSRRTFQRLSPNLQQLTSCGMRHIEKSMRIIIFVIVIVIIIFFNECIKMMNSTVLRLVKLR